MIVTKSLGIVRVSRTEGENVAFIVDRGREVDSLREQAEERRKRAFRLLADAVLMEQAADHLS